MKKITGIIGGTALMLCMAGCSWQMPEKVSVKTQAEYNFSLGNFEKDFSEDLSIDKLLKDVNLPNNGKIYDYWPDKKDKTQRFLMYMPLQEIPIDISQYFDKGALADAIKNISFKEEIEVPKVDFETSVEISLDDINEQISTSFKLAGPIQNYSASQFGDTLSFFADYLSYEKGYLIVKAYAVDPNTLKNLNRATSVESLISTVDTTYSNGTISITSNGNTISGIFHDGVAEINLSEGFDFKADDINISFSDPQLLYNPLDGEDYPTKVFVATIDTSDKTNRPYQIKSVSGLTLTDPITFGIQNQKIDSFSGLDAIDGCTIGKGNLILDFYIPNDPNDPDRWENVAASYEMTLSGGFNLDTGLQSTINNPAIISLDNKSITKEEITANVDFTIVISDATINFTKKPKIGIEANIEEIAAVTVQLSDTELSFDKTQDLPDEVLDIVKSISLNQCGVKGTYTNTLPEGNDITLSVFSDFFNIHKDGDSTTGYDLEIEANKTDEKIEILSAKTTEPRLVKLSKNPSADDEYKEFDFKVDVGLPGGDTKKITVQNVRPNTKYTFALNLEAVIDWEQVTIDLSKIVTEDFSGTMGTGFNPTTIFDSVKDILGEDFAEKIELPDSKLYLYLSRPKGVSSLDSLRLSDTSNLVLFYGNKPAEGSTDDPTRILSEDNDIKIIYNGKKKDGDNYEDITIGTTVPNIVVEKDENDAEIVVSKATENSTLSVAFNELLKKPENVNEDTFKDSQLCVSYSVNLAGVNGSGEIPINKKELNSEAAGSIGIYVVIDLPLSFKMKGDTNIDLTKLMKNDENKDGNSTQQTDENEDIFGRKEASGMDDVKKYIEAIKSVELRYKPLAFPISSTNDITVDVRLKEGNRDVYTQDFNLSTNKGGTFTIDIDEMEEMLDAYPLKLAANIVVPNNTMISIPREKKVNVNLEIGMETDGKIELFDGKNK